MAATSGTGSASTSKGIVDVSRATCILPAAETWSELRGLTVGCFGGSLREASTKAWLDCTIAALVDEELQAAKQQVELAARVHAQVTSTSTSTSASTSFTSTSDTSSGSVHHQGGQSANAEIAGGASEPGIGSIRRRKRPRAEEGDSAAHILADNKLQPQAQPDSTSGGENSKSERKRQKEAAALARLTSTHSCLLGGGSRY